MGFEISVNFTIGGKVYSAAPPVASSGDSWLRGLLVNEWRHTVTPTTEAGEAHPLLRVIFDLREYRDGQKRADITVENCLDVATGTAVTYDVSITHRLVAQFVKFAVRHPYLCRWRKVIALPNLIESKVCHSFEALYQTGAVPRFRDTVRNASYSQGSTFEILGRGGLSYNSMDNAGGRPELAPYPDWTAQYLTHQSPSQRDYMLASGDLAGSVPIHIRNPDGSLISIDQRPNFWLDAMKRGTDDPKGDLSAASTGPLTFDRAHQPSLSYVPYLVTGDRYHADEMAFWANGSLLATSPQYNRSYAQGLQVGPQIRDFAWPLRNLADAAAYLPDASPYKAYLTAKLANNLTWADAYARGLAQLTDFKTAPPDVLGSLFAQPTTDQIGPGKLGVRFWQLTYVAWCLDHASRLGFVGGKALRDRIADFQLRLFTSGQDYPREYAGPYVLAVGTYDAATKARVPFATTREMFEATYRNADGSLKPAQSFQGYYGQSARLMLLIAQENGWAGAQESLAYLEGKLTDIQDGWEIAATLPTPQPLTPSAYPATYTLTKGWATFGVTFPQGVCRQVVLMGRLIPQLDVKTRWPDGTIRHGVVTVQVPADGDYVLEPR